MTANPTEASAVTALNGRVIMLTYADMRLEAAIARIVRRERFTEIQARNAADETIYAARHDATNCIQPRKLTAALERIERRHRIRRDTSLARQVRGGFIPSYMKAWRHIGAE